MNKIRVKITKDHIERGTRGSNRYCPLAIAVNEIPNIGNGGIVPSEDAENFIHEFDCFGIGARPCEVEVTCYPIVGEPYKRRKYIS